MKKSALGLIAVAGLALASGCHGPSRDREALGIQKRWSVKESFVLNAEGDPGQEFSGVLLIDGKEERISGVTPERLPLRAVLIEGNLEKESGDGAIDFRIERRGLSLGFGSLDRIGSKMEFVYHNGEIRSRQTIY